MTAGGRQVRARASPRKGQHQGSYASHPTPLRAHNQALHRHLPLPPRNTRTMAATSPTARASAGAWTSTTPPGFARPARPPARPPLHLRVRASPELIASLSNFVVLALIATAAALSNVHASTSPTSDGTVMITWLSDSSDTAPSTISLFSTSPPFNGGFAIANNVNPQNNKAVIALPDVVPGYVSSLYPSIRIAPPPTGSAVSSRKKAFH
ncbi:hypothetical protein B0H10DRAFT_2227716 [Mycena sp. CBHHK59/15]|nr:hypothetical protein B0H10DRAFT_2227716 [Mycena sp. CBHHK59/15]